MILLCWPFSLARNYLDQCFKRWGCWEENFTRYRARQKPEGIEGMPHGVISSTVVVPLIVATTGFDNEVPNLCFLHGFQPRFLVFEEKGKFTEAAANILYDLNIFTCFFYCA